MSENKIKDIVYSNAKINLFLKIGHIKGSLHNIYSLFLPINLYDIMYISESEKFCINYFKNTEILLQNRKKKNRKETILEYQKLKKIDIDNCIIRRVNKEFKINPPIKIDIIKNIPPGGGMGGASSNAAFYVKYLLKNRIITNYSQKSILRKLEKIGSDVPFFFYNEPAFVYKTGFHVKKIDFKISMFIVALYPEKNFSTKRMYNFFDKYFYKNIDLKKIKKKEKKILQKIKKNDFNFVSDIENDFEKVIKINYPEIYEIKKLFKNSNKVLFTGSGSSLFGIYKNYEIAEKDFFLLKKKYERVFFLSWIS